MRSRGPARRPTPLASAARCSVSIEATGSATRRAPRRRDIDVGPARFGVEVISRTSASPGQSRRVRMTRSRSRRADHAVRPRRERSQHLAERAVGRQPSRPDSAHSLSAGPVPTTAHRTSFRPASTAPQSGAACSPTTRPALPFVSVDCRRVRLSCIGPLGLATARRLSTPRITGGQESGENNWFLLISSSC